MSDPIRSLASALLRDRSGIVVVYYPDAGVLDWIIAQVSSVAGADANPLRTSSIDDAVAATDRLVIVSAPDEVEAVLDLNARRDQVLLAERSFPLVLLLLRGGSGHTALVTEAPGLWSVIRGSDPDPDLLAEIDVAAERQRFEQAHGMSPEAWLARWRRDELPSTAAVLATAYDAMLLEEPDRG